MGNVNIHDMGKKLEEEFFARQNAEAVEKMRKKLERDEQLAQLREASNISDDSVLDALLKLGITAETLAAMSIFPLVAVAWADMELDDKERRAILDAAAKSGIQADSVTFGLLESWLEKAPGPSLFQAWENYVSALINVLDLNEIIHLKREILGKASTVADASGGIFGLNKTSGDEKRVLQRLENAFK